MVNLKIQYDNIIIIIIVASAPASTRPDPRGRGQDPRGRGQDPRVRGHKILASRGLEAEARPRGLASLRNDQSTPSCAFSLIINALQFNQSLAYTLICVNYTTVL